MKTKIICLFFAVLLLVGTVLAAMQNYESAVTSRIVGNSPADIIRQLKENGNMDLAKAINGGSNMDQIHNIVSQVFSDYVNLIGNLVQLENELDVTKDVLLIINPINKVASMRNTIYLNWDEVEDLRDEFKANDDLVILNSPYSGLYIPYERSLTAEISPYSTMVGPMSYSSDGFLKSLLCNLGEYDTIGETYRQARNNYYWNTGDKTELIGVTLVSYSLYGMPTNKISVSGFDKQKIKIYCKDYWEKFPKASVSSSSKESQTASASPTTLPEYSKEFEFVIQDYQLETNSNYTIIKTNQTINSIDLFSPVLPKRVLVEEFPIKTIITDVELIGLSNSIDLSIPNLPMYNGFNYVERECYEDTESAGIEFSKSYTENTILISASISPVEVINCSQGLFKLYQNVNYKINYIPYSTIIIDSVKTPLSILPNQDFNVSVNLINIDTKTNNGYIIIKDSNEEIIAAKEIVADNGDYVIGMTAPDKKGVYNYKLEWIYENESRTYKEFKVYVSTFDTYLITPEIVKDEAQINVIISSNLENQASLDVQYTLLHNNVIEDTKTETLIVKPGLNTFNIEFNGLDRNKVNYDLLMGISYSGSYDGVTAEIITEHVPVILQGNIEMNENETFLLDPEIYDIDDDPISWDIESNLDYGTDGFSPDFDKSGEYIINITADDGIKTITKSFLLEVKNTNRAPGIDVPKNITVYENQTQELGINISDPDNLNSVSNDDNNLSVYYSQFINESSILETDFDSSGNYTITATVFDGELFESKSFKLEIINVNRAPEINDSITVFENSTLNLNDFAYDPDNLNSVSNDDNELTISTSDKFDSDGVWDIDFDSSGIYKIEVSIDDGQYNIEKNVTINIRNVNRAPMITSSSNKEKTYYITEQQTLPLNITAEDPDKEDSIEIKWYVNGQEKSNDKNYEFSSDGITGDYNVKASVSDGNLDDEVSFNVVVSDVPVLDGFDGDTTNPDLDGLNPVFPFILEKLGKGKIEFKEPLDLSETVDFVNTVYLEKGYTSLDSEFLDALRGKPAHVTLYDLDIEGNPIIYYSEGFGPSLNSENVCPSSICYNINYTNNTLEFDVTHFSSYFIQGSSYKHLDLNTLEEIIIGVSPNSRTINVNFVIENNGLASLDNLQVSSYFSLGYDLEVFPETISLPSGQSATISITGEVDILDTLDQIYIGDILLQDSNFEKIVKVYLKQEDFIAIENIELKTGYGAFLDVQEGQKIKFMPDDPAILNFDLASLFLEEEGFDLKDVEISVYLVSENGNDFEGLYSGTFDLDSGERKIRRVSFTMPSEEKRYELKIKLTNEINGMRFSKTIKINLRPLNLESDSSSSSSSNNNVDEDLDANIISIGRTIENNVDYNSQSKKKSNITIILIIESIFLAVIVVLLLIVVNRKSK